MAYRDMRSLTADEVTNGTPEEIAEREFQREWASHQTISSAQSVSTEPEISVAMQEDAELQSLMQHPAYLRPSDPLHKAVVAKVNERIEQYAGMKVEENHFDGVSSTEILAGVDDYMPLRSELRSIEIQGKRLTQGLVDEMIVQAQRSLPLKLTADQAREVSSFVEKHPLRFYTGNDWQKKRLAKAINMLSYKLREVIHVN
jgi:hypothetical protein